MPNAPSQVSSPLSNHSTAEVKIFRVPQDVCSPAERLKWKGFLLENGTLLPQYHLAYTTYGQINQHKTNVVWIFHALTGNSKPHEWWDGLVGAGKLIDPSKYFIVCVNTPGSCYGSIGPLSNDSLTGMPYYHSFPWFTPRDMVRSYEPLRRFLGIDKIWLGIGGSLGGQQLLEWAALAPQLFTHIVPIATNAKHSAWGIAFNTSQRMAIEADTTWHQKYPDAGMKGMMAARAMALISYRSYDGFALRQADNENQNTITQAGESVGGAASYQRHQGKKLADRFNAFSYYALSKTMDSHYLGRQRSSIEAALQAIQSKTLVIGIDSDLLFPPVEQEFIASHIPFASLAIINSLFGHDGFLLEYQQLEILISGFLNKSAQ